MTSDSDSLLGAIVDLLIVVVAILAITAIVYFAVG